MPGRNASHETLDDVLSQIVMESQEKLASTPVNSTPESDANVMRLLGTIERSTAHHEPTSGESVLAQSGLSPRQRSLPTLSLRMIGSVVAMFVLVAGAGAATLLTQQSQDVRNQAYDGKTAQLGQKPVVSPDPSEVVYEPTEEQMVEQQSTGLSPKVILGGVFIALSILILLGMFVWLFAV